LPIKAAILLTDLGTNSKRQTKVTVVECEIEGDKFNHVFLLAPQLMVPMTLDADFLNNNKITLIF
jgi:hypothetical protein